MVGQKLLHSGSPKLVTPEQFFQFTQKIMVSQKKLFNMKIFSIKFGIKKVTLIFGVRWLLLLKNAHVPQNVLNQCVITFGPPYICDLINQNTSYIQNYFF